jgi:AcrR family transcriptional regulator
LGSKERRQRQREDIRTRILDAARELLATEGVESMTMRGIAERIEYSPTAIYLHFRDKESLLAELSGVGFRTLAQAFDAGAKVVNPVERLRAAAEAYISFGLNNPSQYQLMFMTPKARSTATSDAEESSYASIKRIVSELMANRRLRDDLADDVDLLSQVVWSALHGVVALEIAMSKAEWLDWRPVADRAHALTDFIIKGVLSAADRPLHDWQRRGCPSLPGVRDTGTS